ncbi:TPA: 6-aminohexanoate hydrolase, partial [Listeria innocua]|nr:6-aminohexanoate hydrolase [Listeria innocua]
MNNTPMLPPEKILIIDELVKKKYSNIRGLSIFQNENHVLETYYGRKTKNDKFNVASITKSVISLLIGIAIDKGYIRSVNEKVIDFFPEYKF